MHKKLELFGKSTHTTMLNPNLSSENCGKKIQSDRPKKWSKITILSPITFWENSRSWSWSDLRSLFEQVILMWSKIAKKVIGHYFDSHLHIENQNIVIHDLKWGIVHSVNNICATVVPTHYKTCEQYFQITVSTDIEILVHNCQMGVIWVGQSHHHLKYEKLWCSSQ